MKDSIKELRWNKIKFHVEKAREMFNAEWIVVLPSTSYGYLNILELPLLNSNYNDSFDSYQKVFKSFEEKHDQEKVDELMNTAIGIILNQQTKGMDKSEVNSMLWFLINFFNEKDSIEVFEKEHVTFIDFELIPEQKH